MPEPKKLEFSPAIAILLSGVLVAGAIIFVNRFPAAEVIAEQPTPTATTNVPAPTAADHRYGAADAPVVLVEYSDLQCPYCSVIHPTLKRIVDESAGQIAWVYRHLPLESIHPEARPAAMAAECIAEQLGNDGFWKFADAIFADQSKMNASYYKQLATTLGAEAAAYDACVASDKHAEVIDTQTYDAQANGGTGTPFTVIIKGDTQVPVSGALPYAQLKAAINSVR